MINFSSDFEYISKAFLGYYTPLHKKIGVFHWHTYAPLLLPEIDVTS
ncbi:hypothetical protein PAUR_a2339 [Pseudoalteromonas aurantia 208]|uniref:Uncharacterized protein n=1 Tax=Pseudoalteromonas aurantia 208 TaxID=1314867 RepID=A0ABR9ECH4_9GAMM|nr:hypothetical protein [Pseudoalteromonas aurantia 208]